jgi:hypothetical protein
MNHAGHVIPVYVNHIKHGVQFREDVDATPLVESDSSFELRTEILNARFNMGEYTNVYARYFTRRIGHQHDKQGVTAVDTYLEYVIGCLCLLEEENLFSPLFGIVIQTPYSHHSAGTRCPLIPSFLHHALQNLEMTEIGLQCPTKFVAGVNLSKTVHVVKLSNPIVEVVHTHRTHMYEGIKVLPADPILV